MHKDKYIIVSHLFHLKTYDIKDKYDLEEKIFTNKVSDYINDGYTPCGLSVESTPYKDCYGDSDGYTIKFRESLYLKI